jgi:ARC6-like, IMS domain
MNCKQLLSIGFIPLFITLQGCQNQTVPGKSKLSCADSSTVKLDSVDVKEIVLTPTITNHAGVAANNRSKGYKFVGKKGQKISFNTKPNGFCTWLYSSDNQIINEPTLPQDGSYVIQVAAAENSGTFEIAMSLGSDTPPPSASLPPEQPSSSPSPANTSDMTKEEATKLISTWLEAKKSIFGSSYNKDLGKELTIGKAYERNITANSGEEESSVDYFKGRREYYTYELQEIHNIASIRSVNANEVVVKALVSEYRTIHRADGSSRIEKTSRGSSCYLFQKDGDAWKIAKDPSILKICD